jgi:DNA repair and recombination protein RAD52
MSDLISKLNEKMPSSAIQSRQAGGGRSLSYVSGHYVYSKLNEVLGQGNWYYQINNLQMVHSGLDAKDRTVTSYIAIVKSVFQLGDKIVYFDEVGYGDGIDASPGKSHELATKEAVTDAVKRAAKNLGPSFGLALYDKEQKDVVDDSESDSEQVAAQESETKEVVNKAVTSKPSFEGASKGGFKKPSLATKPGSAPAKAASKSPWKK